ncbi:MAG: protein kinase [Polyangiaceae bacterium]|nr:protein kinase [Polyangiaceae bacterium]
MTDQPSYRSTITQALADTVIDDSRSGRTGDREARSALDGVSLPDVGDLVGGLYRLIRPLGQGTFGKVFVAERIDVPEHQVALKLMMREMISGRNVERELVMLAAAGHPNIVQLKDHGSAPDCVWFTTPVYEGETLAARLSRGRLTLREAYDIFLPIARGIEALHRAGLRHQDLKPENIFLAHFAGRLHPIVLDLGVAAERTSSFVAGTILYASPEQVTALTCSNKELPLSEKMDTYGLACTLLVSLVEPAHFPGANAGTTDEMLEAHRMRAASPLQPDALPVLTGVPREKLQQAMAGWFAIDPAQRPAMTAMAEQLEVLLEKEREEAQAETRRRDNQKAKLQHARLAVASLLVLGLGLLGIAFWKRETLELATQLEEVSKQGAVTFDHLETCQASHSMSRSELGRCEAMRQRDQTEFKSALASFTQAEDKEMSNCAQRMLTYATQLSTCRDDAEEQKKAWDRERDELTAAWASKEQQLSRQREEAIDLVQSSAADLVSLESLHNRCEAGRLARSADNPYESPSPLPATSARPSTSARPPASVRPPASGAPPATPGPTVPPAPTDTAVPSDDRENPYTAAP